ncbi:hypothetical protein AB0E67_34880 [Streptomyces sp. NPDC032161]|uniref:hypothetical protein n=1 Tax=unclassified Streptomyces TaxID=2593676 RepID=UPI0033D3E918
MSTAVVRAGANLCHLAGGIAAAWAHTGQRVLLLEEAEDYWRWTMSGVRRSRSRRKKETEPATPPEPTTSTLWASPDGPGVLVRHTCMWEVRDLRGLTCGHAACGVQVGEV